MRDMARGHDVVGVADSGLRFRLGAARNCIVFADLIARADDQIAAFPGEGFVERVGSQRCSGRYFIAVA